MREALDRVLAQADLFLPSGPELFLFTRAQDDADAIAELLRLGACAPSCSSAVRKGQGASRRQAP
jgi:sugar/nucleoside kinase (ribokinase family)